ncbi:hypothetical protein FKM82_018517 [Ascaphus truei]
MYSVCEAQTHLIIIEGCQNLLQDSPLTIPNNNYIIYETAIEHQNVTQISIVPHMETLPQSHVEICIAGGKSGAHRRSTDL